MKLVALTGGIAAGKTTIARALAALGAVHIDADQLAREAVAPGTDTLETIRERFGAGVIAPDGTLDRSALATIVFADPEARADLDATVHPAVRRLAQQRIDAAAAVDPDTVIVYDVPLLVEAAVHLDWHLVIVAEAPTAVRASRLTELRGMSPGMAAQRIASQASDAERRAIADIVIDTGGTQQHTIAQVEALWRRLQQPATGDETPQTSQAAPERPSQSPDNRQQSAPTPTDTSE